MQEKITVLAFSTAKSVLGFSEQVVEIKPDDTVATLLERISPDVRQHCKHARVALDQEFADWSELLAGHQELAIIPPVSGG